MTETAHTISGLGLATVADDGTVLDTWYPAPALSAQADSGLRETLDTLATGGTDAARGVHQEVIQRSITVGEAPVDTPDAYLRLHAISHRLVQPNQINVDGIFALLPNNVWTNFGPCQVAGFEATRARLRQRGPVTVYGIDKFPRMLDYVSVSGVRVADADRVRLGAHLAEGTTVMHEGFVNFNAGTLGSSMVEGRISAGVVVGDGTDIGGGASIMGTLSGGNEIKISLGERVLLGANSGVMIPLGNDCVVEAGLYLTAGSLVKLLEQGAEPRVVKARELAGASNLLFRRNSSTGEVEALVRDAQGIQLNAELHAN